MELMFKYFVKFRNKEKPKYQFATYSDLVFVKDISLGFAPSLMIHACVHERVLQYYFSALIVSTSEINFKIVQIRSGFSALTPSHKYCNFFRKLST